MFTDVPTVTSGGLKVKQLVQFLLCFASFLTKANGDIEKASQLYSKAIEVDPESGLALASYAVRSICFLVLSERAFTACTSS